MFNVFRRTFFGIVVDCCIDALVEHGTPQQTDECNHVYITISLYADALVENRTTYDE
jgi:hypothetical protein